MRWLGVSSQVLAPSRALIAECWALGVWLLQFFTLVLASCLSIGAPAPSSVFSVRPQSPEPPGNFLSSPRQNDAFITGPVAVAMPEERPAQAALETALACVPSIARHTFRHRGNGITGSVCKIPESLLPRAGLRFRTEASSESGAAYTPRSQLWHYHGRS